MKLNLDLLKVQSFEIKNSQLNTTGTVKANQESVPVEECNHTVGQTCEYTCNCVYTVNYPGICVESEAVGTCPYNC